MNLAPTADLWWKNAVIYCLDVQTFADSNGDGVGDFGGLLEHLDYLAGLGITCLWLMPFYPTADLDDGYDISEHYGIDPRLGSFGDSTEFMATARDRGIRVIADLVVNHTSTSHSWFQAARLSPESPSRDFYVWRDEVPAGPVELVFPGHQKGVWTFDPAAGQYYLHRFYHHQPDLNVASPEVRHEIRKLLGFWLAQGLSGFRIDAVPFLIEGLDAEDIGIAPHDYLRDLRAFTQRRSGHAALLGEVNLGFAEQRRFFGDDGGDELHMLFDFVGMQATHLALACGAAGPIADALRSRPELPTESALASFLRNHDQLTLDQLTDAERAEVFAAFGPEPDMQISGRGLRRRLPPMLSGDQEWIRMAYSLMFSMPGPPTLFYGEQIGMGENLDIEGRMSVRTPMQWNDSASGGFSTVPPDGLVRPLPGGGYAPDRVNVQAQRIDPDSLLNWLERLIRLRKELPEVGWGVYRVVDSGHPSVLALDFEWQGRRLVTLHNLAGRSATTRFDPGGVGRFRSVFGPGDDVKVVGGEARVRLQAREYRWLRVDRPGT